jgi:hypothetical protein
MTRRAGQHRGWTTEDFELYGKRDKSFLATWRPVGGVTRLVLVDRQTSPRDDPDRRPSHADRRRAWRREVLQNEIRGVRQPGFTEDGIQAAAERMLELAAGACCSSRKAQMKSLAVGISTAGRAVE